MPEPIWVDKAETARRIRGRIEKILDWATVHNFRTGDNPARWHGRLEHALPSHAGRRIAHFRTLPYRDVPKFMRALRMQDGVAARALEFTILTVVRTSSIIGIAERDDSPPLMWDHIDLDKREWYLGRTKTIDDGFLIPLSDAAMAVLREMHRITGGKGLVFPGGTRTEELERLPMSNGAMASVLRRMKVDGTPHAITRATFETWSDEVSTAEDKVIDAVMTHGAKTKLKAAYSRGQLYDKRRALMEAWATFLMSAPPALKVVA
ncbi:hypothetical protein [Bradyrhizobium sp. Tv2a-2]|uniref:tyrosine-type recombinase/integrase n=1 Tax=Bradyrhizobium sp. Tv2a-2 TaxID=113395 RepID=UPI00041CEB57|nr:hypothetical protein [Bradyrhizobium sp. Tv2a-2]